MSLLKNSAGAEAHVEIDPIEQHHANLGRPSRTALPDIIRLDNVGHIIIREANNARKKCRLYKNNVSYFRRGKTCVDF